MGWGIFVFVDPSKVRPRNCVASKTNGYVWSHAQSLMEASYNQEIDEVQDIVLFPQSASF